MFSEEGNKMFVNSRKCTLSLMMLCKCKSTIAAFLSISKATQTSKTWDWDVSDETPRNVQ